MADHFIGLMSGTSADGIDAVVARFSDKPRLRILAHHHTPYGAALRARILALMTPGDDEIDRMGALETELAEMFAAAADSVRVAANLRRQDIGAIGSHGQTLRHRPGGSHAFTLQIGDPSRIAERTGITTVADFRRRDMAAGGQGAPLVPAFHRWLFWDERHNRAIANIGGIANVTLISRDPSVPVIGFDTGPGNALLDAWIQRSLGLPCDTGGAWAAQGRLHAPLLATLLQEPYFAAAPPKSTGREHFTMAWLEARLARHPDAAGADVQATLTRLTAQTIVAAIGHADMDELFVCGGGSANDSLMRELRMLLARPVDTTAALGLAPDLVEPAAFAWLAAQTLGGRPGNLPSVTGATHAAVLGGIYAAT
ncbi:MAG: anhydro-N-acetylmuramic acid kinase [Gammaproteobacteria bacterium]|nr:anhydro-N-acetylmuramic acid kinase [Gammaproteobacteria bacterium]